MMASVATTSHGRLTIPTPGQIVHLRTRNHLVEAVARTAGGTVVVSSMLAKSQLNKIAEEIIGLLSSDPNATVSVTLDIAAEFDHGVDDGLKRNVSENAGTRGFKTKDWE